mgnify:CR=1 FL=1
MESYRKLAFTEEVESILAENNKRLKNIFGTHDQFTGRGMEGHSHRVVIDDYPIRVQWLTEEVFQERSVSGCPESRFHKGLHDKVQRAVPGFRWDK